MEGQALSEGKWVLEYWRYFGKYTHEADTKEEALSYGCNGEDYGDLSMSQLFNPQGAVDMDAKALSDYYCKTWDR